MSQFENLSNCDIPVAGEKEVKFLSKKWWAILFRAFVPVYDTTEKNLIYQVSSIYTHVGWVAAMVASGAWTWSKAVAFFKGMFFAVKSAAVFIYTLTIALFRYLAELA